MNKLWINQGSIIVVLIIFFGLLASFKISHVSYQNIPKNLCKPESGPYATAVIKHTTGNCKQENKPFDFSAVDSFINHSLDRICGGCNLILIRGSRIIYRKAYGNFTLDKTVPIASASKWISGGVIMSLVDEGIISLEDPVSKYLPEFKGEKGNITIRQLFSHTHGFPVRPRHHWNTRLTMEEAVDKIAQMDLLFEPGTKLFYSGTGMQVAGRICEVATGMRWVDLFKEKIKDPLGMDHTSYYAFGKTQNPNVPGSVETCINDYGKFMMMLLNKGVYKGKRILSGKAVEVMLTNQTGKVPIERSACASYHAFDPDFAASRYGIGCWLEHINPQTGKAQQATSGGAFGCIPFIDLKREIAGVYLPYCRNYKRDQAGEKPYNDATAFFLALRKHIRRALDGTNPSNDANPDTVYQGDTLPEGQNMTDHVLHQKHQRKYIVHMPPQYNGEKPVPAVLVLHGGIGTAEKTQRFTEMNKISDQNGFLVIYPQAFKELKSGYIWADGRGTQADHEGIDDVDFINKLLDTLIVKFNLDTSKIYVCGFSNGGFMTMRLACEIGERFAAVAGLGCSMDTALYNHCNPSKPLPVIFVNGTADPFVPFDGGIMNPNVHPIVAPDSAVQFWVTNNHCESSAPMVNLPDSVADDNSKVQKFSYTDCTCNADVTFYKIINGGHTWPGVENSRLEFRLGETNEDIHASRVLWNFFKQHSLCDKTAETTLHQADYKNQMLQVYPVPASSNVYVESSIPISSMILVNQLGQIVYTYKGRGKNGMIAFHELNTGLYYLKILLNNGHQVIKKLIK